MTLCINGSGKSVATDGPADPGVARGRRDSHVQAVLPGMEGQRPE